MSDHLSSVLDADRDSRERTFEDALNENRVAHDARPRVWEDEDGDFRIDLSGVSAEEFATEFVRLLEEEEDSEPDTGLEFDSAAVSQDGITFVLADEDGGVQVDVSRVAMTATEAARLDAIASDLEGLALDLDERLGVSASTPNFGDVSNLLDSLGL